MKKKNRFVRWLPFICATLLLLGSSMSVFAATVYHLPSDIVDKSEKVFGSSDYNYLIYRNEDNYYIVVIPSYAVFYHDTSYQFDLWYNSSEYMIASSSDGSNWNELEGYAGGAPQKANTYNSNSSKIVTSNVDVYTISANASYKETSWIKENSTGVFFQRPPVPIAELAIPLTATVQKQTGIILPIAVCCLALLIGSIVLLPRLKIFLLR